MQLTYDPYRPQSKDELTTLVRTHMHLIESTVDRMVTQVPSYLSKEDMTAAAMSGLIDAANRFDRSRGVLFKTFAEHRIRGAIFDEMRKMDWFSRTMREKHSRLTKTLAALENRFGRSPEEDEMAQAMHLSLDEYRNLLVEVSHLGCVSLFETLDNTETGKTFLENLQADNMPNPESCIEAQELTGEIARLLEQLSEKERLVITLYYYEELNQKEIAEVLEVSEGRVSQLHSQALLKLKTRMQRAIRGLFAGYSGDSFRIERQFGNCPPNSHGRLKK